MNKKGFTLIELLAVIIIIGLLTVLIAPKITNSLKESEKKTNLTSAQNLVKTAELKATNNEITGTTKNTKINYTTGENISYLDYTGQKPEKGQLNIKSNGKVAMSVKIGEYCYEKSYISSDIKVTPYNENTCGENSEYLTNYERPDLAISGDGLYEAFGEPDRYVYRGANPNNYIKLKENGTDVLYRILSFEPDDTIKVIREDSIGNIPFDTETPRKNTVSGYYCTSQYGCNVWGNQTNTYYNDKTLSELNQDFYFYYYPANNSVNLSIKPNNNFGIVDQDSTLNTYLNETFYNTLDFKDKIDSHSFNVGGVYYYNYFNNGYQGGDKGLLKEKVEEQVYTWNGKIAMMNITEFVETSLSPTCTSVYSNYYYQPNNVTQNPNNTSQYTAHYGTGNWPCALQNWNYKNYHQRSLSAISSYKGYVWNVYSSGFFNFSNANSTLGVRPAFYLKSSIKLRGFGTYDSPYELVES